MILDDGDIIHNGNFVLNDEDFVDVVHDADDCSRS
jgi:hypothetical protein